MMIDAWGGWNLFQDLLSTLKRIAQKHNAGVANVATNYILANATVAGVIIGVRLGIVDHRKDNLQVFNFCLDKSDCDAIDAVCTKSNNLFETIGDCGDGYRQSKRSTRWILILVLRSGLYFGWVFEITTSRIT
jgi:hypothetical protein